jgi:hypothetical protein
MSECEAFDLTWKVRHPCATCLTGRTARLVRPIVRVLLPLTSVSLSQVLLCYTRHPEQQCLDLLQRYGPRLALNAFATLPLLFQHHATKPGTTSHGPIIPFCIARARLVLEVNHLSDAKRQPPTKLSPCTYVTLVPVLYLNLQVGTEIESVIADVREISRQAVVVGKLSRHSYTRLNPGIKLLAYPFNPTNTPNHRFW